MRCMWKCEAPSTPKLRQDWCWTYRDMTEIQNNSLPYYVLQYHRRLLRGGRLTIMQSMEWHQPYGNHVWCIWYHPTNFSLAITTSPSSPNKVPPTSCDQYTCCDHQWELCRPKSMVAVCTTWHLICVIHSFNPSLHSIYVLSGLTFHLNK